MRNNDPQPGDTDNILLQKIAGQLGSSGSILTQLLSPLDFWFQASLNKIPGLTFHRFTGLNPDVDIISLPEDIWESGGLFSFQATGQNLEIVSTSAADTAAGTGLRTVFVEGLNSLFMSQSETVSMSGLTAVPLVNQYLRINMMTGITAGSGVANAGDVTLRVAGAGATQAFMGAGSGHAHRAIYTVSAGHTARVVDLYFGIVRGTAGDAAELQMNVRSAAGNGIWVQRFLASAQTQGGSTRYTSLFNFPIAEKSDIRLTCSFVTVNNSRILATGILAITDNAIFPP